MAKNDIKRSNVFNNANEWSRYFAESTSYYDEFWYGKIYSIRTDQGGNVASITIQSNTYGILVSYETDDEIFTTYDDLIIKRGTKLYNQISELAEGEKVQFRFYFVWSNERGIFEKSITEYGSITEPEYMVKFITIEPLNKTRK